VVITRWGVSDHYETLGVGRRASTEEITSAYKALVVKYHPDRHEQNDLQELAEEKLKLANAAYQVLSNPQRRRLYDAGRMGPAIGGSAPQAMKISPEHLLKRALITGAWIVGIPLAFRLSHNPALFLAILGGIFVWRLWRRRRRATTPEE
jgi:curved DNA-binding protein CbpA